MGVYCVDVGDFMFIAMHMKFDLIFNYILCF